MIPDRPTREDAALDRDAILEELEQLLVQGGAAVIATDLDGVITHWSAGAERIYGWSGAEAIGQPVFDLLIDVCDRAKVEANLEQIRITGTWEGAIDLKHKGDGVVPAYVRGTIIKDDAGRQVGLLGLSMDVSER